MKFALRLRVQGPAGGEQIDASVVRTKGLLEVTGGHPVFTGHAVVGASPETATLPLAIKHALGIAVDALTQDTWSMTP